MKIKKLPLVIIILHLCLIPSFAQNLSQQMMEAIEKTRTGNYFNGARPFEQYTNTEEWMPILSLYEKDTSAKVRDFIAELYASTYTHAKTSQLRQTAVDYLCNALSDSIQQVRSTAAQYLAEIPKEQFTESNRQAIIASFSAEGELDEDQVLLAGYLEISELGNSLQYIQTNPWLENRIRWCAYLALARMGDESALSFILKATKKKGINDQTVYNYFPDLIYTRQREAFDYLIQELFNNEKNCNSPNPNFSKEIVCGYRIMEFLAPVVKDFPFNTTASGSLDVKNYDKALETTRKWFEKHKKDYVILTDKW